LSDYFCAMKRRSLIIIFAVLLSILLTDFLVYMQTARIISQFSNSTLVYILKLTYWAILPLFATCFFFIWKKLYTRQRKSSSGIMFRLAGIFILIYIPKILFAATLLLLEIITLFCHLFLKEYPLDFIPGIGISLSGIAFMFILYGITLGRFRFKIRRIKLPFKTLPDAFDGFKAIHISDLHTGSLQGNQHRFTKAIRLINEEKPDLIFFTGDIVNEFSEELEGWENVIGQLHAEYGKFSVLGNHDYGDYYPWKNIEEKQKNLKRIIDWEKKMGFKVLMNESAAVIKNGQEINILGVENWGLPPFKQYGRLELALGGTENSAFKILLSHDPSHWDAEISGKTNIDLTLSGHTHGFQFGIRTKTCRWSPVKWIYPRWEGLHRSGDQFLHINTGLGYIGFPGRIGMPPEITVISFFRRNSDH
jgi:predicted MPP superfamily phosphohydrolase